MRTCIFLFATLMISLSAIVPGLAQTKIADVPLILDGLTNIRLSPNPDAKEVALVATWTISPDPDPVNQIGLSLLAATLVPTSGAGDMDPPAMSAAWQDIGGGLLCQINYDQIMLVMTVPKANAQKAIGLLSLLLNKPATDVKTIERIRKAVQAQISTIAKQPNYMAYAALNQALLPTHPIVLHAIRAGRDLPSPSPEQLAAWRQDHLARDNLAIGLAGAFDVENAAQWIYAAFGDLPAHAARPPRLPVIIPQQSGEILGVDREGETTVIQIASPTAAVASVYSTIGYASVALNEIMSGNNGLLFKKIRVEKGLSYAPQFSTGNPPLWFATTVVSTPNDQVEVTLSALHELYDQLVTNGATTADLNEAKARYRARNKQEATDPRQVAPIMARLARSGETMEFNRARPDFLDLVPLEHVNHLAQKQMIFEAATITLVGQPDPAPQRRMITLQ